MRCLSHPQVKQEIEIIGGADVIGMEDVAVIAADNMETCCHAKKTTPCSNFILRADHAVRWVLIIANKNTEKRKKECPLSIYVYVTTTERASILRRKGYIEGKMAFHRLF